MENKDESIKEVRMILLEILNEVEKVKDSLNKG